jgi:hypothetical protein
MSQMDMSYDEEDEEFEMCMIAMGCHLQCSICTKKITSDDRAPMG